METRRLLGSLLVSSTKAAGKILAAVASSTAATGRGGERWKAMDHLRYITMIALWITVWMLRIFMDYLLLLGVLPSDPNRGAAIERGSYSSALSTDLVTRGAMGKLSVGQSRAIGRALCHVLSLVNDVPVTARKYDFVVSIAERILDDNAYSGSSTLQHINRAALSSAFSRTSEKLRLSLQNSRDSDDEIAAWPICLLKRLLAAANLRNQHPPPVRNREELDLESEKLAQELLWIANKMRLCESLEGAVMRWSLDIGLSSLSVTANPRSQGPLIKISVMLLREMAQSAGGVPRDVRFRILALWMPLLCYAANGVGSPVLSGREKLDAEGIIGEIIQGLPREDQELILGSWMEDFAFSASDWPDLRGCYDQWCRSSRKLLD